MLRPYRDIVIVGEADSAEAAVDESARLNPNVVLMDVEMPLIEGSDCVIHNSFDWAPLKGAGDLDGHLQSNLVGSIRLLEAAAPRAFIFLSSVSVHHDMRPRWEGLIDDDHPLRPATPYGAYKAAVEVHLLAAYYGRGQPTSAIRPCGVYGIDPRLERSIGHPIVEPLRARNPLTRPRGGQVGPGARVTVTPKTHLGGQR